MAENTRTNDAPFGTYAPGAVLRAILHRTARVSNGWLSRRLVFALRKLGVALLAGRPADVERLGCHLRLHPAQNTAEKRLLFTPHLFDPEERAYLAANLPAAAAFADIGANVGGYALFVAAQAGPSSRILAVEPQPDVYARLSTNIRQSGLGQIIAQNCAISDQAGEVTLHINVTNKGESSMLSSGHGGERSVIVTACRLGPLLREHGFTRLDALKIDVEGVEDRILADLFAAVLPTLWPTILIVEDAPTRWTIDVPALIESNGYRQVLKTATNLIYRREGAGDPIQSTNSGMALTAGTALTAPSSS